MTVAHRLIDAGIDPARSMTTGHTETQPQAPNDTPAQRALTSGR